jgi:hypothetical protein
MTSIKLKHLDRFVDRHGKVRYYFRRGRGPRIALPGEPGSLEFIAAYQQSLNNKPAKVGIAGRGGRGTFDQLVRDYFGSPDFLRIAPQTQTQYRGMIERFLAADNVGHRQVHEMTRQHVQAIIARRAGTPAAANNLLKRIRMLMHFAIDNGWLKDDPTIRIKRFAEGNITLGPTAKSPNTNKLGPSEQERGSPSVFSSLPASAHPTLPRWLGPMSARRAFGLSSVRPRQNFWCPCTQSCVAS